MNEYEKRSGKAPPAVHGATTRSQAALAGMQLGRAVVRHNREQRRAAQAAEERASGFVPPWASDPAMLPKRPPGAR